MNRACGEMQQVVCRQLYNVHSTHYTYAIQIANYHRIKQLTVCAQDVCKSTCMQLNGALAKKNIPIETTHYKTVLDRIDCIAVPILKETGPEVIKNERLDYILTNFYLNRLQHFSNVYLPLYERAMEDSLYHK